MESKKKWQKKERDKFLEKFINSTFRHILHHDICVVFISYLIYVRSTANES